MIETFTAQALAELAARAGNAPRLRANLNVHKSLDAAVQRLFIATEPGTYIRPHRHSQPDKWEFFVVLSGAIDLLVFDPEGKVRRRVAMAPDLVRAVEVPAGTWHTYVCMKSGTVALEVKQGAYIPPGGDDLPPWAPPENTPEVAPYLQWLREAQPLPA